MRRLFAVLGLAGALLVASDASAGAKGDAWRSLLVNKLFRADATALPSSLTARLYTTCPTASTAGTEVSATGYSAPSITSNTTNWSAATAGGTANATTISFGTAGADWTGINCVGLTSGTDLYYFGPVVGAPVTVLSGETATVGAGSLAVAEIDEPSSGIALDSTAHPAGAPVTAKTQQASATSLSTGSFATGGAAQVVVTLTLDLLAAGYPVAVAATCGGGSCSGLGSFTLSSASVNSSNTRFAQVWTATAAGALSGVVVTATPAGGATIYVGIMGVYVLTGASATPGTYGTITRSSTVAPLGITTVATTTAGSWVLGAGFSGNRASAMTADTGTTMDDSVQDTGSWYDFACLLRTASPVAGGTTTTIQTAETADYAVFAGLEIKAGP